MLVITILPELGKYLRTVRFYFFAQGIKIIFKGTKIGTRVIEYFYLIVKLFMKYNKSELKKSCGLEIL